MSSQLGLIKDEIVLKARAEVNDSIPPAWRLTPEQLRLPEGASVIDMPRTCGLLTPKHMEITEATATELLSKISIGELSSSEVTEAFCIRAAIAHQVTNCLTAFFPEEGLQTAAALDKQFRTTGKTVGPLHGLPVCIKDMYDLKGRRSTMAYISWFDVVASADSALVAILRDAGAVFYSKTTMPQTGMMLETRSPLWGVTTNPFNNQLVSGGSSGGDGVLVAMRGSPIAPSSDIGGSIRAPAAFNGLYSIRPSADRIPKGGLRSTAPGNVSIKVSSGPVCHNIVDLKMFTKIINAHGSLAHFEPGIVPIPWRELPPPVPKYSFGVWTFDGVCMPHPPILRAIKESTLRLTSQGHEGTRCLKIC
ncbi:hypothetical protein N7510_004890 [Penicillium lagena]|uniref:uncharacterized protein n=1 Tax=Penicillium lagena TaxID=94218 RepID=UPI0025424BCD|nr:uncharacterized protein N7510_004890 [Penicillium lagena]KAJ5620906.1 hypothetical protein N7510_004890 [Penicillium lagena]